MTGRYQAYTDYRSSEASWCGNVPTHWQDVKFKWILEEKKKTSNTSLKAGSISFGKVIYKDEEKLAPETKASYQEVLKGELLINPLNLNFDLKSLRTALSDLDVVVSTGYIVAYISKGINRNYMRWVMHQFDVSHMKTMGSGVRQTINYTDIANSMVCIAPTPEQQIIANFLDHETAKIDTLITKQEKLIELLKEKHQAVISHAVTKGLNPNVAMKATDSGWVEKIPKHWSLGKLGYFAKVGNGATPARDNKEYWKNGSIGWLNSSKVNDEVIYEADQFITPLALSQTSVKPVVPKDLVMAITGEGQTRGRVAICQVDATINQHLASIAVYDQRLHYEFLHQWLCSNYERIRYESSGAGATKGAITCGDISGYPIIIAPLKEQLAIVRYLKVQAFKFINLINKSELQINLLKERKTALISAAVTGKIDVRDWDAQGVQG
ncbi:restriction endonuclease subunit S [Shewanella insulae]|uniref:restriction endonuclease subunit S n=1 Tax=Shewanella insulae TaxID=2681496 RepID=UPI001EFCCA26|nr:restriction endonuclease subunit S [Shewanella insulae]MCG9714884.1 restriction endonuclease subunit S [Shewanella insulae]